MIAKQFGEGVAVLVDSVTEKPKDLSWEERKKEALEHIATFSNDSVLVKSGDVLSNGTEIVDDYKAEGEAIFTRFNKPKEIMLGHYVRTIQALLEKWPDSPLAEDLKNVSGELEEVLKH